MDARIRLGQRIGRGGMAEVFAAQLVGPAGFEKDVAVKRLLPRFSSDPVFLERFLNEARLAARLSHPNIVQIFELGHDGNDPASQPRRCVSPRADHSLAAVI